METILTLLLFLLPVIFKLIGKKLEKSGQPEKAQKVRELLQTFGEEEPEVVLDDDGHVTEVKPVIMEVPQYKVEEKVERQTVQQPDPQPVKPQLKPAKKRRPMLEEPEERNREKIDPKKLVIYSEIMKPKYTEQ